MTITILGAIHRADIEALTWEAWASDVPMSWIGGQP